MDKKDLEYEGKRDYELDIDRMVNEGMAGGTVNLEYDRPSIGEVTDIPEENDRPKRDERKA